MNDENYFKNWRLTADFMWEIAGEVNPLLKPGIFLLL